MGSVGTTTDTFILFENGVRRNGPGLPGLSNPAGHMPSKPDPPQPPVGNLIWGTRTDAAADAGIGRGRNGGIIACVMTALEGPTCEGPAMGDPSAIEG